ncbi:MAG TPA: ABC transporter substrate-binding protein, partial [Chloroflexota bacterium]
MAAIRIWLLGTCGLILILAACGGAAAPSTTATSAAVAKPERPSVKIVYGTASGEDVFAVLAAQKGFFQRYGVSADVSYAASNVGLAALTSGEAQFNLADGVGAVQAIVAGSPTKVLAYFDKLNPYALVTTPEVKQIADLKGRTVAISKFGDTSEISLRMALKDSGVTAKDLDILQVGNSPARFAALQTKQVAGAVLDADAFAKQAQAQGMNVLVDLKEKRLPYVASALLVTDAFAKDNPNTVTAVLRALIDGGRFFSDETNQPEVMSAMAKELKLTPGSPELQAAYDAYRARPGSDPYPDKAGVQTILEALRGIDAVRYGSITP